MLDKTVAGLEHPYARLRAPGQVQSFGAMLAVHPSTLRVLNASENVVSELGISHEAVLGRSLLDLIETEDTRSEIKLSLEDSEPSFNNPMPVSMNGQRFDLIMHAHDGLILAEFEALTPGAPARGDMDRLSDDAIMGMMVPGDLEQLMEAGPQAIRLATGFDRVLLYRFDDAFRGQVVGEARRPGVESFMGMFFPESDIGAPARDLYTLNFSRYIPHIGASTSLVKPADNVLTNKPLDMSHSVLRAVAPCHIDYLANMGVTASMSFSIVSEGRLWGLFACHHYKPAQLSFTQRLVCEQIAMMFVAKLTEILDPAALEEEMQGRRDRLLAKSPLFKANPLLQSWSTEQEQDLLRVVNAEGAAIYVDGQVGEIGTCPDLTDLHALIEKDSAAFNTLLHRYDDAGLFYTSSIASVLPFGVAMREKGSGVMIIPLARDRRNFLLWFRPELVVKATWAGNPSDTKIKDMNARYSPRRSFAAWKEDIRDRAEPWTQLEISIAASIRDQCVALVD
jgi:chemotaxis family two-component system sensor kinase Cph1